MGYVKMHGMLSPELVKALSGNVYTVKEEPSPKDEMSAAWKEFFRAERKHSKKEEKKSEPQRILGDADICCPKKVKFIFVLNNAVVINVSAVAEEDARPR
jgi:hypothetical protein